jgi:hypothetical protein
MAKSPRDTIKQLMTGHLKDLNKAGMKITNIMLIYGEDYPELAQMCQLHRDAVAQLLQQAEQVREIIWTV